MKRIQKIMKLFQEFGIVFSIKWCFYKFTKQNDKFIDLIYCYLYDFLKEEIELYNKRTIIEKNNKKSKTVWVCWWQGYDLMPDFCKMCYKQLCNVVADDAKIILITKDNYQEYSNMPDYIIEKLNDGIIPVTQFSDILRESLILNNGGLWIDASVWCNKNFNDVFENLNEFWSIKLKQIDDPNVLGQKISNCMWSGFILGGSKDSIVYDFVFSSMCKYFKAHNFVIDYFIQNLLLRIAYDHIYPIRNIINNVEDSNQHLYDLYRVMDEPFNESVWNDYTKNTIFFKLTQKRQYRRMNNNQLTFYSYLLKSVENINKK